MKLLILLFPGSETITEARVAERVMKKNTIIGHFNRYTLEKLGKNPSRLP